MLGGEPADDLRCVVARAIVHHHNFGAPLLLLQVFQDALQCVADARALVIRGDNDAVLRLCRLQVGIIPRKFVEGYAHAACAFFFSMAKNSGTSFGSQKPLRASSIMVCSASS